MRQIRECWSVLARKAADQVQLCHSQIAQSQTRVDQLQASQQRLQRLYDEYRERQLQPQPAALGMDAQISQRQFMAQLLQLQQRVQRDLGQAQAVLAQHRKSLLQAEAEHQKMKTLAEQDALAVRREHALREQRQIDELAVARFNLRVGH